MNRSGKAKQFPACELKNYAEPVTTNVLKEGEIYFSLQYVDESLLIPMMETWVFVGKNLRSEDAGERLYFQDVGSYQQGVRYQTATGENSSFQVATHGNIKHIFEFENALKELMKCGLRRKKSKT